MDNIYVINLPERTDKREKVESQLKDLTKFTYSFFDAIKFNPGHIGCALSHIHVMKDAKEKGKKYVIVFEDDVELNVSLETFEEKLLQITEFCQNPDNDKHWDIILLGANLITQPKQKISLVEESIGLYKYKHAFTTHCMIWSERVFDKFIQMETGYRNKKIGPIDMHTNDIEKKLVLCPFLCDQADGISDIHQKFTTYKNQFRTSEEIILRNS